MEWIGWAQVWQRDFHLSGCGCGRLGSDVGRNMVERSLVCVQAFHQRGIMLSPNAVYHTAIDAKNKSESTQLRLYETLHLYAIRDVISETTIAFWQYLQLQSAFFDDFSYTVVPI